MNQLTTCVHSKLGLIRQLNRFLITALLLLFEGLFVVRSVCLFVFRFSKHLSHAKTGSSVCLGKYYRQRKASVCYTVPGARTPDSKAVIPALLLTQRVTVT